MGRIPIDIIAGFYVNGQIVCPECVKGDELNNLKEGDVILRQSIDDEDEMVFCDRHKGRL